MSAATFEHRASAQSCPRCGAPLAAGQDWCLECGAAAATRVLPPPDWRVPIAIIATVLTLTIVVVLIAVSSLSNDAERSVAGTATKTTAGTQQRKSAQPAKRKRTATRKAKSTSPSKAPPTEVASWPAGKQAYTVILTTTNRDGAERRAGELVAKGIPAGVLETAKYLGLGSGLWIVFSGQFETQQAALAETRRLAARGASGYVSLIKPRA